MTNSQNYNEKHLIKQSFITAFIITLSIWIVRGVETISSQSFSHFGLQPRNLKGIVGVFTSPFIHNHSSLDHIWSNTIPLFVLIGLVVYLFNKIALKVIIGIWLITGIWVWFLAKAGTYHIGASGVIYGLLSFLLFSGILRKSKAGIALSLLLIISYGTMFWGLLPVLEGVSWESHLMGFVSGIILAFYYKEKRMYGTPIKEALPYTPISFSYPVPLNYNIEYIPTHRDAYDDKTSTPIEKIDYGKAQEFLNDEVGSNEVSTFD